MKKMVLPWVLFISCVSEAQSVQPGYWQAESQFEISGLPLPASRSEECVDAKDAKDIKQSLYKRLKEEGCEVLKWSEINKKIEIALKCSKSGLEATGSVQGTVSKKSYDFVGVASGQYQKIPAQVNLTLKGKWVKDCLAE